MRPFDRRSGAALVAVLLAVAGGNLLGAGLYPSAPPVAISSAAPVAVSSAAPVASPVVAPSAVRKSAPELTSSVPVRLTIPAIGVDTGIMTLGVEPGGTMEVPPLTRNAPAGWYRHLASPGEIGPAVIVGHVDTEAYGPAVFYKLGILHPGDAVSVRRADGTTAEFAVVSVRQYAKDSFPSEDVYGPVDRPVLRLITCGGDFDRRGGTYRDSIVVYAESA